MSSVAGDVQGWRRGLTHGRCAGVVAGADAGGAGRGMQARHALCWHDPRGPRKGTEAPAQEATWTQPLPLRSTPPSSTPRNPPVLSEQSMFMPAISSMDCRRVTMAP